MSHIKFLTFDCHDSLRVAQFWAAALGSDVDEESTAEKAFVEAPGWGGPNMWFNAVPEPKSAKNRLHLDLRAPGPIAEEVARLVGLGAVVEGDGGGPGRDARPGGQRVLRGVTPRRRTHPTNKRSNTT